MHSLPTTDWASGYDNRLGWLVEWVERAGRQTLQRFQQSGLRVDRKADDSPVTAADRAAEQLVREALGERFPDDGLLGEEFGETSGTGPFRWVVDPIDGTKSFVAGVPLYSTLLALLEDDRPVAGAIYIPALDELLVAARDRGAWHRRGGAEWTRASVSPRTQLSDGVFVTSEVGSFGERGAEAAFGRLQQAAWVTRTWGDGYGYLLVATGRAEAMVDPIVNPWDVAAIQPILEEAGGRFSDWQGRPSITSGNATGTNGRVHEEVLKMLHGQS